MTTSSKPFYCLRCGHRFDAEFDANRVVERSCPKCGSNSVRIETAVAAGRRGDSEATKGGAE